jgi:hypothetical protein
MEQHESRADQVERAGSERVERVVEDVVLDDLEVREVEPRQVAGVQVGGDHVAGRTDLLGQPHRHRAPPCADLEATPAGLEQGTSSARRRIVDLLEEIQPFVLSGLPPCGGQSVSRPRRRCGTWLRA